MGERRKVFTSKFKTFVCLLGILGVAVGTASAQTQRIVQDPPVKSQDFYRVSADKTHSGLPVPRYVSLKYGRVNGRQGPSLNHKKLWQYQRKGLPVVVVAEMDIWRKIRDMNGDESWVRSQALTRVNHIITMAPLPLHRKPDPDAPIMAHVETSAMLELGECRDNGWCKVEASDGTKGWAPRKLLWGAKKL